MQVNKDVFIVVVTYQSTIFSVIPVFISRTLNIFMEPFDHGGSLLLL